MKLLDQTFLWPNSLPETLEGKRGAQPGRERAWALWFVPRLSGTENGDDTVKDKCNLVQKEPASTFRIFRSRQAQGKKRK